MQVPKGEVSLKELTSEESEFRELAASSNLLSDEEFNSRKIVPAELDMKQAIQTAQLMCKAKTMLPAHLHGNPGECLAIIMLAKDWKMNPYSVGQHSYLPTGSQRVGFDGQLVNAVINNSQRLVMPLRYEYEGKGQDLTCTAYGLMYYYDFEDLTLKKEPSERSVMVKMPQNIKKQGKKGTYIVDRGNSTLWDSDPEQQLAYKAARWWCRKYIPEILFGVYTPQEITEMGNQHRPARDASATPAANIDNIISEHRGEKKDNEPVVDAEVIESETDSPDPEPETAKEAPEKEKPAAFPGCDRCNGSGVITSDGQDSDCPECIGG